MHVSAISGVASSFQINSEDVNGAKTIAVEASIAQASTTLRIEITLKNSSVK